MAVEFSAVKQIVPHLSDVNEQLFTKRLPVRVETDLQKMDHSASSPSLPRDMQTAIYIVLLKTVSADGPNGNSLACTGVSGRGKFGVDFS